MRARGGIGVPLRRTASGLELRRSLAKLTAVFTLASIIPMGVVATASSATAEPNTSFVSLSEEKCGPPPPASIAPIGIPIETLSVEGPDTSTGAIRLNGHGLPDTTDPGGIHEAIIDRGTGAVTRCGTAPRDVAGINQLGGIAEGLSKERPDHYLTVISASGLPKDNYDHPSSEAQARLKALNDLVKNLGGTDFSVEQKKDLYYGTGFSFLGIYGGANGAEWTNIATLVKRPQDANISGDLVRNVTTGLLDFANEELPSFNTQSSGPQIGTNTIEIHQSTGSKFYSASLPAGTTDGFQILALDKRSLEPMLNLGVPSSGVTDGRSDQFWVAHQLIMAVNAAGKFPNYNRQTLVFVQSIGHPRGTNDYWVNAGDTIQSLGGTKLAFTNLSATSDYSLVGCLGCDSTAIEASSVIGQPGPIVGVLAQSHQWGFQPDSGGPPHTVNIELSDLTYQTPTPFPALNTPGQVSAEAWIGSHLAAPLCSAKATTCNVRAAYYKKLNSNTWMQYSNDIESHRLDFPGNDHGFTAEEYATVRNQLSSEFAAVSHVKNYFETLAGVFGKASVPGRVNLKDLGDQVYKAVYQPPGDAKVSGAITLLSKLMSAVAAVVPGAKAVAGGLAVGLSVIASLVHPDGAPLLADNVRVKADLLAEQMQTKLFVAEDALQGVADLFVSDYGKLMAAAGRINNEDYPDWNLDPSAAQTNIALAARRWFAEALVPLAYPWLIRGTPHVGDANGLECNEVLASRIPPHPWYRQPRNAQIRAIESWEPNGHPIVATFFFTGVVDDERVFPSIAWVPTQEVADLLFNATRADPSAGPLGLNLISFLNPRRFGGIGHANDGTHKCDLPFRGP